MPEPRERKVQLRGAKRMRELGRKQVMVWLDTRERVLIEAAAERAGMKLATWIRQIAFRAAEESTREADKRRPPIY